MLRPVTLQVQEARSENGEDDMRKVLMVAAAAAIALVGLSANTCGGGDKASRAGRAC